MLLKIDLHLHTQSLKNGESKKRNIEPNDFVTQMIENKIGMMAITNHNKFDLEEYNDIIEIKPDLKLFPGIELDVMNDEKHYHIIVVSNPIVKNKFYDVFDGDMERNYDKYSISYEEFISKVKQMSPADIVIIPHFANKDRAIGYDFLAGPKTDLEDYITILEPSGLQTMGMVNAHGHLSLIGSDVKDWSKYHKDAIPELKFDIENFEKFHELCREPESFIKKAIENTTVSNVCYKNLDNLPIFEDLNVVFGEKGSGKTILLKEYLLPYFNDSGKKTHIHEGKEYSKLYEKLILEIEDSIPINKIVKEDVEILVAKQLDYTEDIVDFVEKYKVYQIEKGKSDNRILLKKADATFSKTLTYNFEDIVSVFKKDKESITKVLEINERIKRDDLRKNQLRSELTYLSDDLKDRLKMQYKSIYIENNIDHFLSNLKSSADKKSGSKSKPQTIGFASLVSNRLQYLKDNKLLRENLKTIKVSEAKKIGELPGKGIVNLFVKVDVMNDKSRVQDGFNKTRIILNREIISKLTSFLHTDFKRINSYFTKDERDINVKQFTNDIILKSSKIHINANKNYEPSEGEQAILSISGILENYNYDVYIFDEIERGLGNRYITEYVIPQLNNLVHAGKTVIVSTHNANLSINSLPINFIYCNYINDSDEIYYFGNMFENVLEGVKTGRKIKWEEKALQHLEGSDEMFKRRKNIYGV